MLQSLKVGPEDSQDTYICVHWKTFPPMGAGQDAEKLREDKIIDDAQYNRLNLWKRVCGLFQMVESKCLQCPHRRKVVYKTRGPVVVAPDGTETPVVDATTAEAAPQNRHHHNIFRRPGTKGTHKTAAWTKNEGNDGEDG